MEKNDFGEGLTPRQVQAVQALLSERNKKAAAARLGISEVTLWRWRQQKAFQTALQAGLQAQIAEVWDNILRRSK